MSANRATNAHTVALYSACQNGNLETVVELLKRKDINVNWHYQQEYGATPIIAAVKHGHADIVKILLDAGADLYQQKTPDRNSTLHEAATYKQPNILRHLLAHARKDPQGIDLQNQFGNTPLHNASRAGSLECVEMLLDADANVHAKNSNGSTPLHHSCYCEGSNVQIVEALIKAGSDINDCDKRGNTILIIATKRSQAELVETILKYGADTNARNAKGQDAVGIAKTLNNASIMNLIEKHRGVNLGE